MAAATIAVILNVFLLLAFPVDVLKLPSVPITESPTFSISGGVVKLSVIFNREDCHRMATSSLVMRGGVLFGVVMRFLLFGYTLGLGIYPF